MVLLNSADALLTSLSLDLGGDESNPIVNSILSQGMTWFLFYKLILVNSMIAFAGFFSNRYPIGRKGLVLAAWAYSLVIFYHILNVSLHCMTGKQL